jgi:RNA polymerase-binding transcription factor DksA
LVDLRAGLRRSSGKLADEALKGSGQDFSVDHMADHGTDNFEQDFSLSLLQGESDLLREIQHALDKIDGLGELPYGLCENCADDPPPPGSARRCEPCPWIAPGRLNAVPYARLCVLQQELEEEARG